MEICSCWHSVSGDREAVELTWMTHQDVWAVTCMLWTGYIWIRAIFINRNLHLIYLSGKFTGWKVVKYISNCFLSINSLCFYEVKADLYLQDTFSFSVCDFLLNFFVCMFTANKKTIKIPCISEKFFKHIFLSHPLL